MKSFFLSFAVWFVAGLMFLSIGNYAIHGSPAGRRDITSHRTGEVEKMKDSGSITYNEGSYSHEDDNDNAENLPRMFDSGNGTRLENNVNITAYYSTPGIVIPLTRTVATNTIALVESLKSFNGTQTISNRKKEGFLKRARGLLAKLPMEDDDDTVPRRIGRSDSLRLRGYTSSEIEELMGLRASVADAQAQGTEIINGLDGKILEANSTDYDCTDLISRLKSVEVNGTEDALTNEFDSSNIFVFKCTDQMKTNSVSDLIQCMDTEIGRGENATTEAYFYLTAFNALNFIVLAGNRLNSIVMALDNPFSYGDPLTRSQ